MGVISSWFLLIVRLVSSPVAQVSVPIGTQNEWHHSWFELLGLPRNIPSLAHIWLAAKEDGLDLCDYCQQQGSLCDICAIAEAVRELEAESDDR